MGSVLVPLMYVPLVGEDLQKVRNDYLFILNVAAASVLKRSISAVARKMPPGGRECLLGAPARPDPARPGGLGGVQRLLLSASPSLSGAEQRRPPSGRRVAVLASR